MTNLRKTNDEQLEAQRWIASQASREQSAQAAWTNALERAGELAMAGHYSDSRRVLELAKEAK